MVWRLNPVSKIRDSAEFEVGFDGLRYRGTLGDTIDWNLFFFGSYSPEELDFLATAARLLGEGQREITYYDVGANVGQHALFMSKRATRVIAFEPSAWACARFATNLSLNGIDNVRVFKIALGEDDSEGELGSGFKGNSGSRSLTWTLKSDQMEKVEIRRGDDLIRAERLPAPDILKLDVEGYEKRVLAGLRQTLLASRPVILMELIGKTEKGGYRDVGELHAALYPDHRLFTLAGKKSAELVPFDWNREAAVCIPEEKLAKFHVFRSTIGVAGND